MNNQSQQQTTSDQQSDIVKINLTNPTASMLQEYKNKKNISFLKRLFLPIREGSLRKAVLIWVWMTLGTGLLVLPMLFSMFGFAFSILLMIISFILNYYSYMFLIEASEISGKNAYEEIVQEFLHPFFSKCFRLTYFADMWTSILANAAASWNVFIYLLYQQEIYDQNWISKEDNKIDQDNKEVFKLRLIYFAIMFLILVPLLLQKRIESLQVFSVFFLIIFFSLCFLLIFQAPTFYKYMKQKDQQNLDDNYDWIINNPKQEWFLNIFTFLGVLYMQPFVFSIKNQLFLPNERRMKKVSKLGVSIVFLICLTFASVIYICYGKKYVPQIALLIQDFQPYGEFFKQFYQLLLLLYMLIIPISLSVFNFSLKSYTQQIYTFSNPQTQQIIHSLLPFGGALVFAALFPNIGRILGVGGMIINNFNGYIIPILLKIQILDTNRSKYKILLLHLLISFLLTLTIIGITVLLTN